MQKCLLLLIMTALSFAAIAQGDTAVKRAVDPVFEKIFLAVSTYKLNTADAPDDKITRKIKELRSVKGGFNISEAIRFKIEEDRQKKEMPEAAINKLAEYFTAGDGKRMLDNAVIWIYREKFDYKELKQLVKFYKTSAGQKLSDNFPVIMLQSLAAAEKIKEEFMKGNK